MRLLLALLLLTCALTVGAVVATADDEPGGDPDALEVMPAPDLAGPRVALASAGSPAE